VLVAVLFTTRNLLDSREGRAIRALKGGIVMAEAMGVDTSRARMVIFVLAALQACASGWLYAHLQRFVNPTPFGLHIGIEYLFMAVVGGAGRCGGRWWAPGSSPCSSSGCRTSCPSSSAGRQFRSDRLRFDDDHRAAPARDGLWPLLARLVPVRAEPKLIDPTAEPLPKKPQPPHGETILEAREVTRRFGGLVANNNMSLSVKAGEILA
jgi:branched-chain amino acid transport system ATP-binding protein